jgi:AraC-like DNA-binding protein
VLGPRLAGGTHERYLPSADLAPFVEHYWTVSWDLRGEPPRVVETLPHPAVHLVLEEVASRVGGPATGKFSRTLEGLGRVVAVKFQPAGFYPLIESPVNRLTDRRIAPREVFGRAADELERAVLAARDIHAAVELLERFLRERRPVADDNVMLVNRVAARIVDDSAIRRVEDLAAIFPLTVRTLQRRFARYVGVSPKWVIQRHRLHEAAEALGAGKGDIVRLALELGYFDQAHFIKDFKAIVGVSPTEYMKRLAAPQAALS